MPPIRNVAGPVAVQPLQPSQVELLKKFEGTWKWVDRNPTDATNMAPLKIKVVSGGLDVTQMHTDGSEGETYKLRGAPSQSGTAITLKSSGPEEAKRGEKRSGTYEITMDGDKMHFNLERTHEFGGWIGRSRSLQRGSADYVR
jgi:hypothetical protein